MSVTERVGKRPQKNSVKLIDLPKPDTGLATKNNTKNNTVNSIMDIENINQNLNFNNQLIEQDEKSNIAKNNIKKSKSKGTSSITKAITTPTNKNNYKLSTEDALRNSLSDTNTDEIIREILNTPLNESMNTPTNAAFLDLTNTNSTVDEQQTTTNDIITPNDNNKKIKLNTDSIKEYFSIPTSDNLYKLPIIVHKIDEDTLNEMSQEEFDDMHDANNIIKNKKVTVIQYQLITNNIQAYNISKEGEIDITNVEYNRWRELIYQSLILKCGTNREEYRSSGHQLSQSDMKLLTDKCILQHLITYILNDVKPIQNHLKVHAYYLTPPMHILRLVNIIEDVIIPNRINIEQYWEQ